MSAVKERTGRFRAKDIWHAVGTLNFVGALAVIVGARTEHLVYLIGAVLLLPGSVLSSIAINASEHREFSVHWNCCGTNSPGMIDLLFLPFALFLNLLLTVVIVWAMGKWIHGRNDAGPVPGLRQH